jgi:hypothetical protein
MNLLKLFLNMLFINGGKDTEALERPTGIT